jgi:hypothetical protein
VGDVANSTDLAMPPIWEPVFATVKLHTHELTFESKSLSLDFKAYIRFHEPFRWIYTSGEDLRATSSMLTSCIRYCLAMCGYPDQLAGPWEVYQSQGRGISDLFSIEHFQEACEAAARGLDDKRMLLGIKVPAEVHEGIRSPGVLETSY